MTRRFTCAFVAWLAIVSAAETRADDHSPSLDRIRRALERRAEVPTLNLTPRAIDSVLFAGQKAQPVRRDSVWDGAFIGAGIGAVGGYFWARNVCGGTDDTECFVISAPVGILAGIGIGAAVGTVADALHK